jgi:putative oxidoreductase
VLRFTSVGVRNVFRHEPRGRRVREAIFRLEEPYLPRSGGGEELVLTKGSFATHVDGALLALRMGSGLFLVATFGWHKFLGYLLLIRAGDSLATSGLAPLIQKMGFPVPALLAIYAVVNESVGALFVACGLWTRVAAFCAALSMAGALYISLRLGEEPLRAALYLTMFSTLALTGPGKFSIDYMVERRRHNHK